MQVTACYLTCLPYLILTLNIRSVSLIAIMALLSGSREPEDDQIQGDLTQRYILLANLFYTTAFVVVASGSALSAASEDGTLARTIAGPIFTVSASSLTAFCYHVEPPAVAYLASAAVKVLLNLMLLSVLIRVLRFCIAVLIRGASIVARKTALWKLHHTWQGTYVREVRALHANEGAVVQVGPYEYSVSDTSYFGRCSKLSKVRDACSEQRVQLTLCFR